MTDLSKRKITYTPLPKPTDWKGVWGNVKLLFLALWLWFLVFATR